MEGGFKIFHLDLCKSFAFRARCLCVSHLLIKASEDERWMRAEGCGREMKFAFFLCRDISLYQLNCIVQNKMIPNYRLFFSSIYPGNKSFFATKLNHINFLLLREHPTIFHSKIIPHEKLGSLWATANSAANAMWIVDPKAERRGRFPAYAPLSVNSALDLINKYGLSPLDSSMAAPLWSF